MEYQFTQLSDREKDIKAIAEGYENKIRHELWVAEAVQKDAIQNSWDNRDHKNKKDWKCKLSFLDLCNKKFVVIVDEGTTGLIGTKFEKKEDLVKILLGNKKEEDLAYFLNSNWSAKTGKEGGTRGRGKTMFLAASKDRKIFFDSLRSTDDKYVFGEVYLDVDKEIKYKLCWDDEARKKVSEIAEGKLAPLLKYGTRVMIVNPYLAMEKAFKDWDILYYINNCWWEIIKKFDAQILVEYRGETKNASVPFWYQDDFTEDQKESIFKDKLKSYDGENIKNDYRTKRFILRYVATGDLPGSLGGIAIQRSGMTIERLSARDFMREEGASNIYGWIEMDEELNEDMKKNCENPEHFDFRWHSKPATYLKEYMRGKVTEFGKELKLIESEQSKANKIQKVAGEKAAKKLGLLFKKLELVGTGMGGHRKKTKTHRRENEKIRLSYADLELPNDGSRVNYNDKITGTYVIPINESDRELMVSVKVFIVLPNGNSKIIEEREFNLKPGEGPKIGKDFFEITKEYEKGDYSFRAKMLSLEDADFKLSDGRLVEKSTVLYDRVNKKFYVEIDPPDSGFIKFIPDEKNEKTFLMDWQSQGDEGYNIYYNKSHPKISPIISDEEKLSNYLVEQGGLIAFQIKIEEIDFTSEDVDKSDEFLQLVNSLPTKGRDEAIKILPEIFPIMFKKFSEFLWESSK